MIEMLNDVAHAGVSLVIALYHRKFTTPEFLATAGFALVLFLWHLHARGYRFGWPRRMIASVSANISFYLVNTLFAPAVYLLAEAADKAWETLSVPRLDPSMWANMPDWVLVPLALLAYDFANYWNHRLMHMHWLWPVHAIHHSDPDVTGLTTYRVHFLEPLVMLVSYTVLLGWLGFPPDVLGYGAIFVSLHNIYVHVNVDWDHGPFRHVLASPRYHRWHHADVPAAYGKNLANIFPVFDLMFGTYYVPGRCDARMGAPGVPENDVVKLLLYPFQEWTRMIGRWTVARGADVLMLLGFMESPASRSANVQPPAPLDTMPAETKRSAPVDLTG